MQSLPQLKKMLLTTKSLGLLEDALDKSGARRDREWELLNSDQILIITYIVLRFLPSVAAHTSVRVLALTVLVEMAQHG